MPPRVWLFDAGCGTWRTAIGLGRGRGDVNKKPSGSQEANTVSPFGLDNTNWERHVIACRAFIKRVRGWEQTKLQRRKQKTMRLQK
jgi:hypothetical protein